MTYQKVPYCVGEGTAVLQCNRLYDKTIDVRPDLPGNIIVIHGVNDVGTSYGAVEQGLCQGLDARLYHIGLGKASVFKPGTYRMPGNEDKDALEPDPDVVFFKRQPDQATHSPVIPFYWGFREVDGKSKTHNGQRTDRYGNRLDKDLSKGGGPFANATSTLPDMWGKGKSKVKGLLDAAQRDATHPVLDNPGRMYMILAGKRLAALIAMIHDYDENEAVTLVAHSQGCMLSLLAQAFLLHDGMRPAETLILNNPPYSLVDEIPTTTGWVEGSSGEDAAMHDHYDALDGRQTLHARLQTLINIVQGVVGKKHATPALAELTNNAIYHAMVGAQWAAATDRDNRGKVMLYFCPEDMTVALNNVQGIGWQGVPNYQDGWQLLRIPETHSGRGHLPTGREKDVCNRIRREPIKELGASFFQRVFTAKKRNGMPVLIGLAKPHDFVLRTEGEDDQAHTDVSDSRISKKLVRAHLPEPLHTNRNGPLSLEKQHFNLRTINGEALPTAVAADLCASAQPDAKGRPGAIEEVDPIDAAIAVTSDYGLKKEGIWQIYPDPTGHPPLPGGYSQPSPQWAIYPGFVIGAQDKIHPVQAFLNKGKPEGKCCTVIEVFDCIARNSYLVHASEHEQKQVLVHRTETPDEARLRWQHATGARSFHGAIFGSSANHRNVTAYDVAIGGGQAASDPKFYAYLCAVADWRLTTDVTSKRQGILIWDQFIAKFNIYWSVEPPWRKALIEGNANYYSTGKLPDCIPNLPQGLPSTVVCETMTGKRTASAPQAVKLACGPAVPAKKGGA